MYYAVTVNGQTVSTHPSKYDAIQAAVALTCRNVSVVRIGA